MNEWLPVLLGCTWGMLAAPPLGPARGPGAPGLAAVVPILLHRRGQHAARLALGALVLGALTALVNGEVAVSAWFALGDAATAVAGTAVGVTARAASRSCWPRLAAWARRRPRPLPARQR